MYGEWQFMISNSTSYVEFRECVLCGNTQVRRTEIPTEAPEIPEPSEKPSEEPSEEPLEKPTEKVTEAPSELPTEAPIGYNGENVTVTFYHTMNIMYQQVLDKYIAEFNKIYPNIHIEHMQVGGYDEVRDSVFSELAVGGGPSIAYCYPDHVAQYNLINGTLPLDRFIESAEYGLTDAQISDFFEVFYNEGRVYGDGCMYSLPMAKSTEVLYYNKTFFEANGLSVPTTWTEFEAVCAKIKEIDPTCIPLGYDSEGNWFVTLCEQFGSSYTSADGEHYLFDNETNREFMKTLREWYDKGYITTKEICQSYTSSLFTNTDKNSTKCYMSIASTGGAVHQFPYQSYDGTYPFEVGMAPIPTVEGGDAKAISQGPSLCMFEGESAAETTATWLFMKFLTTNAEFQAEYSMTSGYLPAIKSACETEAYKEFLASANGTDRSYAVSLALKTSIEISDSFFTVPGFYGSAYTRDVICNLVVECLTAQTNNIDAMIEELFIQAIIDCRSEYPSSIDANAATKAWEYIETLYGDFRYPYGNGNETTSDFTMISDVSIFGETFTVNWTTDRAEIAVVKDGSISNIIVGELGEEINYTLTGEIISSNGEVRYIEYELVKPGYITIPEVLETPDGENVYVKGTVRLIYVAWNDANGYMNVSIVDADGNELYIYRLTEKVEQGDIISVYGTVATYHEKKEIQQVIEAGIIGHEDIVVEYPEYTIPEVIAAADGTTVTVNGTVLYIYNEWSDERGSMTVSIVDAEGNALYIYSLATKVELGDIISVKGIVDTYRGTRQIHQGATAEITGHDDTVFEYTEHTIPEVLAAADGRLVIVKGTVCRIDTGWNETYGNISVTVSDADGNELYIYRLAANVNVGDVITVKGIVGSYNGEKQISQGATATIDIPADVPEDAPAEGV